MTSRHVRRSVARAIIGYILGCSAGAAAEAGGAGEPARPFSERALRLSVGTGLTLGLSDVQERDSDLYIVSQAAYRWNVSLAPSYRIAPAWELGVRGSWSSDAGARARAEPGRQITLTRSLWQLAPEARFQPRSPLGTYVAVTAGAAAAVDAVGEASATQWAPALGGALGYDIGIAAPFALGVELRGGLAWFGDAGAELTRGTSRERFVYGTSSWIGLNVAGRLCL